MLKNCQNYTLVFEGFFSFETMKKRCLKELSWNFVRFQKILNPAFGENFSCLSQKLVNPLSYVSSYVFLIWFPLSTNSNHKIAFMGLFCNFWNIFISEYSCAIQKDILVHGRLYATVNYLCFYANIFRWETSVALRWKDVNGLTKEKTALVIPNAIQVCLTHRIWQIRPLCPRSKWNMGEILAFLA